ncbi:MAG: hypothetical protein ABJN42_19890 [Roseibium sp.]|uniref:hypothetical protein n=1 Tax=Roseibium sp. TaxID=1936156 RepID=UPI0032988198
MNFLPFPAELARISATAAQARVDARKSPGSYKSDGAAAYRTADGKVQLAYDPYKPQYPEGAEPGLAVGEHNLKYYPNDTSGYESHATNFMSIEDLRATGMRIDETSAGIMSLNGQATMIVADDPDEMQALAERITEAGGRLHLGVIDTDKLDRHDALQVFLSTRAIGGMEVYAAPDIDKLVDIARERYSFIEPGNNPDEFLENLQAHAEKHNWDVCFGDRDELGPEVERQLPSNDPLFEF